MNFLRACLRLLCCVLFLAGAGCKVRPRYAVGDHLIPLGNSDPAQIVTVVEVERESYRVTLAGAPGQGARVETRVRREIDSDYVRIDLPVGGSWTRREDQATPAATENPAVSPSATIPPTPAETSAPQVDFGKVIQACQPSLVTISVFNRTGKLTKTGAGFFVAEDGRIATALSNVAGAVNAIAKTSSGKLYNVSGLLGTRQAENLAIVAADVKGVPFLPLSQSDLAITPLAAAIVRSSPREGNGIISQGKISTLAGASGDALQLTGAKLTSTAGMPVVSEDGAVVGIATADENGAALTAIRPVKSLIDLLKIAPSVAPTWPDAGSPTPSATPKVSPTPSPNPAGNGGLIYTPPPRYPTSARFSYRPVQGSGRFLIQFDRNGNATSVQTVQSTGSDLLDNAAVDALRQWRARPGPPSQRTVPITFTKPR